ncbi:efflux RND transporter permease subunit [Pseudomonas aeruginosa]
MLKPLSSFVTVTPSSGPDRVIHYNGYPSADISGGALPGVSSGQAVALMERPGRRSAARGHDLRMDRPDLPQQKLAGNSALFIFPLCACCWPYLISSPRKYNSWLLPLAVPADRRADVPAQRDRRGVAGGRRQQRVRPDRAGGAGRPGGEERDP